MHLDLLNFYCFFVIILGVAYRGYMSRLLASEEQNPKEEDYDYTEELGDDQTTGVASHPTS